MIGVALLFGLLVVASVTDVRSGRIPNAITYTGMVVGLSGALIVSLPLPEAIQRAWGVELPRFTEALAGWALAGFLMVFCYVVFAGQVGGGDVKLLAMVGAFLGPYAGIEVLLWTFIIGAAAALIRLIWQGGATRMLVRGWRYLSASLRAGRPVGLDVSDRETLKTPLYLAPCTLAGLIVVLWIEPWLWGV
ncbi:MAG: prepilin peptidase [Planctomycetales bacterium]|nr:prepilin peptidase [Planctomycetales bacterium]